MAASDKRRIRPSWAGLLAKIVCGAVAAGLILSALSYAAVDSRNSITGNTMRDLYDQKRVDLVFLGSSTVYESCVPDVFDAEAGVESFNAATPAQTLRESYHQLKEVRRLYRPTRVLLGLGPQHLMDSVERDSLSASYLFDNMRWSPAKLEFLADAFNPDYYASALFPVVRLREELTADDVKAAARGRASESAGRANPLEGEHLRYVGKGYVANMQVIEDGTLPEAPPLGFSGPESADADALAYLSKIVSFCAENDMELTLFHTPFLPGATEWIGDYAAYHDFIADYAERAGIAFMDFNYLNPAIITYEDGMFSDLEHATEDFARRFSEVFAGLVADGEATAPGASSVASGAAVSGEPPGGADDDVSTGPREGDEFFTEYDTYRELYDAVASTWVTEATESGARVASIGTATPEYRVSVLNDDEDMETVYAGDWQTDDVAAFPPLESGDYVVTVEARPLGDEDAAPKGNWTELHVD
ncbi:MAG: hypothetical protein LBS67_07660 [Clostridiales Family XIII bacterium]|jgi:hypothetical protein|nr:hypothetical protein [Clostridiales Family XIII bacterium]